MSSETWFYETLIPRSFVLDDGSVVVLRSEDVERLSVNPSSCSSFPEVR